MYSNTKEQIHWEETVPGNMIMLSYNFPHFPYFWEFAEDLLSTYILFSFGSTAPILALAYLHETLRFPSVF
jgi:hypothetical protein